VTSCSRSAETKNARLRWSEAALKRRKSPSVKATVWRNAIRIGLRTGSSFRSEKKPRLGGAAKERSPLQKKKSGAKALGKGDLGTGEDVRLGKSSRAKEIVRDRENGRAEKEAEERIIGLS